MATEGGPDALGPRYAPADPTLPEPWKGLVDGSTGVLYYWNPETNVTQYEKPNASLPPLPSGPPPVPSAPKLAAIPGQPNGHQMTHNTQQHAEQVAQQNISQLPQGGQQLGSQMGPGMHQLIRPQMGPNQHTFSTVEQQMPPQQGVQVPQTYPPGQQQQGYQFMHYMGYQQNMPQPGLTHIPQHTQHPEQFPQQEQKAAFLQRGDTDFQQGKQVGFSPSQTHQIGVPPVQSQPPEGNSSAQPGQTTPYGGSQLSVQQPSSFGQLQHSGINHQQPGPRFQTQMGQAQMHGPQPNVPPVGFKLGFEETQPGRGGNEHYFNANNDGLSIAPHQPKLAAIPMARNQPEMRFGGPPPQNVPSGVLSGSNNMPGPASHNIYGHATGGPPYPNNPMIMQNPAAMTSQEAMNMSSVDIYRQKHDVTATGDNVPAPFMSFESTGFPPEILREVRYLLQRRSICRTLPCHAHTYATSILIRLQIGQLEPSLASSEGWLACIRITLNVTGISGLLAPPLLSLLLPFVASSCFSKQLHTYGPSFSKCFN